MRTRPAGCTGPGRAGRAPRRRSAPAARGRRRPAGAARPRARDLLGAGVAHDDLGAPPGVPRREVRRPHPDVHVQRLGDHARRLDGVRPRGRAAGAPPARDLARAGEHDGDVQRLVRQRCVESRELVGAGPPVDRQPRGRRGAGGRTEDPAGLEQGQVGHPAADVAPGRGQQAGQQGGAQQRFLVGQRVRQPQRPAPFVVGGQPEGVQGRDRRTGTTAPRRSPVPASARDTDRRVGEREPLVVARHHGRQHRRDRS